MKEEQISAAKTKVAVLQTRLMSDQDWQESGQDVDCMSLGDEIPILNASQRPVRMRDDRNDRWSGCGGTCSVLYATASIRNECAPAFLCSNLSTAYLNNVSRALRIFFGLFLPVVLMLSRTGIGRNSV